MHLRVGKLVVVSSSTPDRTVDSVLQIDSIMHCRTLVYVDVLTLLGLMSANGVRGAVQCEAVCVDGYGLVRSFMLYDLATSDSLMVYLTAEQFDRAEPMRRRRVSLQRVRQRQYVSLSVLFPFSLTPSSPQTGLFQFFHPDIITPHLTIRPPMTAYAAQ